MIDPITLIAMWLQMDPAVLLATIPIVVIVCNFVARLIPDDAVGVLGFVRKLAKFFGLYLSNRVTKGVTVNDVVGIFSDGVRATEEAEERMKDLGIKNANAAMNQAAGNPFSRARDATGKFLKNESGRATRQSAGLLLLVGLASNLGACTTTDQAVGFICAHQDKVRAAAEATIAVLNQCPADFQ